MQHFACGDQPQIVGVVWGAERKDGDQQKLAVLGRVRRLLEKGRGQELVQRLNEPSDLRLQRDRRTLDAVRVLVERAGRVQVVDAVEAEAAFQHWLLDAVQGLKSCGLSTWFP